MKKLIIIIVALGALLSGPLTAYCQTDSTSALVLTLDQAIQIALDQNVSVKVADKEIQRTGYARSGAYSALYPQVNVTGNFQRTIKKQRMYVDMPGMEDGMEVGRYNAWTAGVSASMPLVNAQLWKSLKISDEDVELAVEKARSSRLSTVNEVKQSFFRVLLAKAAFKVYRNVYDNAVANFEQTERKFNAQRASELDMARAKTAVANAVPNACDSESAIILALWQLKAVLGVDLDADIDVAGTLLDFTEEMSQIIPDGESISLDYNSTMRQLAIQADQLAETVKMQKYAYIPTLSLNFAYNYIANDNTFNFENYHWSPYSYAGLTLSIPIFSGMKRLNDVRQAKVRANELDMQRTDTERQLKISIRQYINQMETAVKSLSSAESAATTAQKAYDITQKSYAVGRSTFTDLNDAQLALTESHLSICQAIHSYIVAKANLESTIGADFID